MKEKELTAVEWLINEIDMQYPDINVKNKEWMIDKAKEMEEEQLKDAWDNGCGYLQENSQQYYNETFKQEQ
jgi:hypothetical protein